MMFFFNDPYFEYLAVLYMKKNQLKKLAKTVVSRLGENYPDAKCHLDFTNDFELLISTVLAARSFIF